MKRNRVLAVVSAVVLVALMMGQAALDSYAVRRTASLANLVYVQMSGAWPKEGEVTCQRAYTRIQSDNDWHDWRGTLTIDGTMVDSTSGRVGPQEWAGVEWTPPAGFFGLVALNIEIIGANGEVLDHNPVSGELDCPIPATETPDVTETLAPTETLEPTDQPTVVPSPKPEPAGCLTVAANMDPVVRSVGGQGTGNEYSVRWEVRLGNQVLDAGDGSQAQFEFEGGEYGVEYTLSFASEAGEWGRKACGFEFVEPPTPTVTLTATPTDTPTSTATTPPPTPGQCVVTDVKGVLYYEEDHWGANPVTGDVTNVDQDGLCDPMLWLHVYGSNQYPESDGWLESQVHVGTWEVPVPGGSINLFFQQEFPDGDYCYYQADLTRVPEARTPPYYAGNDMVDYTFIEGKAEHCRPTPQPSSTTPAPTPTATFTPTQTNTPAPVCRSLTLVHDSNLNRVNLTGNATPGAAYEIIRYEYDEGGVISVGTPISEGVVPANGVVHATDQAPYLGRALYAMEVGGKAFDACSVELNLTPGVTPTPTPTNPPGDNPTTTPTPINTGSPVPPTATGESGLTTSGATGGAVVASPGINWGGMGLAGSLVVTAAAVWFIRRRRR